MAFANKIYDIAYDLFGMTIKDRKLLISIGEKMREIDPYCWINYTFKKAEELTNRNINVVITDMRKIEEYSVGMNKGYFPVRIVCDRDVAIQRLIKRDGYCDVSLLDNPIEVGTRNIQMFEIDNNGSLKNLYKQIDGLIKWMEKNIKQ